MAQSASAAERAKKHDRVCDDSHLSHDEIHQAVLNSGQSSEEYKRLLGATFGIADETDTKGLIERASEAAAQRAAREIESRLEATEAAVRKRCEATESRLDARLTAIEQMLKDVSKRLPSS